MTLHPIETVEDLHNYLYIAIQLEHATIPPYLTALYSIHPNTNKEAFDVIRVVAVEEMLHLTLSANILNAVGGTPDLSDEGFVPLYPTYLPNGETDFKVGLERFSVSAIDTFLNIERPASLQDQSKRLLQIKRANPSFLPTYINKDGEELHFYSIGEFYNEIAEGIEKLVGALGEATVFCGDPAKQVTPEYYYSGGGDIIPVYTKDDALEAIRLISEQGEGLEGGIYDHEGELSHYYRFQQIKLGRYYHEGDKPNEPSGDPLNINWDAVYPVQPNARITDYPKGSELRDAALDFNIRYKNFLQQLTDAFNGAPSLLMPAVGNMFRIKELFYQLMRNPIPGNETVNGAPTFELDTITEPVTPA